MKAEEQKTVRDDLQLMRFAFLAEIESEEKSKMGFMHHCRPRAYEKKYNGCRAVAYMKSHHHRDNTSLYIDEHLLWYLRMDFQDLAIKKLFVDFRDEDVKLEELKLEAAEYDLMIVSKSYGFERASESINIVKEIIECGLPVYFAQEDILVEHSCELMVDEIRPSEIKKDR